MIESLQYQAARDSLARLRSDLGYAARINDDNYHGMALVVEGNLNWETSGRLLNPSNTPGRNQTLRKWAELYLPRGWAVVQLQYDVPYPAARAMRRQAQAASCWHATIP